MATRRHKLESAEALGVSSDDYDKAVLTLLAIKHKEPMDYVLVAVPAYAALAPDGTTVDSMVSTSFDSADTTANVLEVAIKAVKEAGEPK